MSDREKGFYYARYRREVKRQQMLLQKICGIVISIGAIFMQAVVGVFEFGLFTVFMLFAGVWLIVTRINYMKGESNGRADIV